MRQSILRRPHGSPVLTAVLASLMAGALAGCAVYAEPQRVYYPEQQTYYPEQQGLHIPPGHMPPPGMCRIWYPDRPPGHQGPIGRCGKLKYRVPQGAILVRG